MENKFNLDAGKLYIMVGLPASGKSTFLKNSGIPEEMIISTDKMRLDFLGESYKNRGDKVVYSPIASRDALIWETATNFLQARLEEGLTTFFDAASMVNNKERNRIKKIAESCGVEVENIALPFNLERSIQNDSQREYSVGQEVIKRFFNQAKETGLVETLLKGSNEVVHRVNVGDKIILNPRELPHNKYDIIGDVHGLYDDFIEQIKILGYEQDKQGIYRHPKGRNLLLLGDFLDRGQQSIEMLEFVYNQYQATQGKDVFILGNHENKLLNFLRFKEKGKIVRMSPSAALTASDFMKLDKEKREVYHKFLLKAPRYYIHNKNGNKIAFAHAHLEYFDPLKVPNSHLMYSDERRGYDDKRREVPLEENVDLNYSKLFEKGINQYYYVRGHIGSTYPDQKHVLTLDEKQAFDGYLRSVRLEDLEYSIARGLGVNNPDIVHRFKTISRFNFKDYEKNELKLFGKILKLQKEKLANSNSSEDGLLSIFKYKKDVFFKRKWEEEHDLLQCRGIVFDFAGRIVQYPFDKVFNYGEPNEKGQPSGIHYDSDYKFEVVEKLNGFLGNITLNPFKNELLFSTTGSLTSPFVGYIKDMVKSDEVYGDLMGYFSQGNEDMTLMFEVIHPEDPHIIKYSKEEEGIYLIGARKKEYESKLLSEEELDNLAEEIGLRRPSWQVKTFQEALDDMKEVKHEGYMLRDIETKDIVLKLKSSYYLGVKFLGRLSPKKTKFMFANKKAFKKSIDEDFYPIVDIITDKFTEEEFSKIEPQERVSVVRGLINEDYENRRLKENKVSENLSKKMKRR